MANNLTAITANIDIDFIQKDYNSSLDAIITFATVNFGANTSANRLWTDFNTDSFSRNWIEIVAFIADVFFFYFDNQATQSYLQTATLTSAIANIAAQFGYVPASAASASGVATFTTTGAGVIPRGFRVQSTTGEQFYVINPITVTGAGQFSGSVLQGIIQTDQFTAQGIQNEQLTLTGPNVIVDSTETNLLDDSPQITVNGNAYTLVETFLNSNGTDTPAIENSLGEVVGGGGRVYELGTNPDGTPFIIFGDGIFGRQLSPGDTVVAEYRTQGGSAGNIGAQSLVTLIDTNAIVSSVTNASAFSGGADAQNVAQLQSLIPASLRSLERAVTLQDFSDILTSNFNQVFAASAEKSASNSGFDINVYVVPVGNGISSITANTPLLNTLQNFIDTRKMVTIQFQILDAFGIAVLIGLKVFLTNTASQAAITQNLDTALTNFFSLTTGGPSGSGIGFAEEIFIKDLTNVVEAVAGIQYFEFTQFTYSPRVQSNIQNFATTYDISPVTIFPNVKQYEWLLGAAGIVSNPFGNTVFSNTGLVAYTYTSSTGIIQYASPVNLTAIAAGDTFHDGAAATFTILGFNISNNQIILSPSLSVNTTVGSSASGSVTVGTTSYESFKCFRKILGTVTNLSANTIIDNNLDLTVISGVGNNVAPTTLLDNTQAFIINQYATGDFFLVDSSNNIWEIINNQSNTITTGAIAVNNALISTVAAGNYQIVQNLSDQLIVFNGNVFTIDYNTSNTIFSIASEFNLIGTLGDAYEISQTQNNIGVLGIPVSLASYTSGVVNLNGLPDLSGIDSSYELIDSSGQLFNITGIGNAALPKVVYDSTHQTNVARLSGSGYGVTPIQYGLDLAQGFEVPSTNLFSVATFNLQRQGNITGNLLAKIVADSGGLPNLSSVLATSALVPVSSISQSAFTEVAFSFSPLPSLSSSTQYHLVLNSDSAYQSTENSGTTKFLNSGLVGYTYAPLSGVIQYASAVNLTSVAPGNYFQDGVGNLFIIDSVNAPSNQVILNTSLTVNTTVGSPSSGSIIQNDRVVAGIDDSVHSYPNGTMSRYNGVSWSNATLGPNPSGIVTDMIFSVNGIISVTINSNLSPVLGAGASISKRYYDDNNEISLIIGLSNGTIVSATDVNPTGTGTVDSIANTPVDNFVFRTSSYINDITNLRANEIPQLSSSNIALTLFGGIA